MTKGDLIVPSPAADPQRVTLDSYVNNIKALNEMLEKAGVDRSRGTITVVSASANSISLWETFNRPVVIGDLGIDIVIGYDGSIGEDYPEVTFK